MIPSNDDWITDSQTAPSISTQHEYTKENHERVDSMGINDIEDVTEGLVSGLLSVDLRDDMSKCTHWVADVEDDMRDILDDFVGLDKPWENWAMKYINARSGIEKLIELVPNIVDSVSDCPILSDDTEELIDFVSNSWYADNLFENVAANAVKHSFMLYSTVTSALQSF